MAYAWRLISDFHFVWKCCMNHVFVLYIVCTFTRLWLTSARNRCWSKWKTSDRHASTVLLAFQFVFVVRRWFLLSTFSSHDTEQCRIVASQWRKFMRAPKWKIPRPLSVYLLYSFPQLQHRVTLKAIICVGEIWNAYTNFVGNPKEKTRENLVRGGRILLKCILIIMGDGYMLFRLRMEVLTQRGIRAGIQSVLWVNPPPLNTLMGYRNEKWGRKNIFEVTDENEIYMKILITWC